MSMATGLNGPAPDIAGAPGGPENETPHRSAADRSRFRRPGARACRAGPGRIADAELRQPDRGAGGRRTGRRDLRAPDLREPLASPPPSFSVANPARIAFDFPVPRTPSGATCRPSTRATCAAPTSSRPATAPGLVLNLTRMSPYEARVQGRDLIIALAESRCARGAGHGGERSCGQLAAPRSNAAAAGGFAVRDINFRRGTGGEGAWWSTCRVRRPASTSASKAATWSSTSRRPRCPTTCAAVRRHRLRHPGHLDDGPAGGRPRTPDRDAQRACGSTTPTRATTASCSRRRVAEDPTKLGGGRSDYKGDKLLAELPECGCALGAAGHRRLHRLQYHHVRLGAGQPDPAPEGRALGPGARLSSQAKGLDMRKNGNVIWIAPGDELAAREKLQLEAKAQIVDLEPLQTESFQINYHKAKGDLRFPQEQGPDHALEAWQRGGGRAQQQGLRDRRRHPACRPCAGWRRRSTWRRARC